MVTLDDDIRPANGKPPNVPDAEPIPRPKPLKTFPLLKESIVKQLRLAVRAAALSALPFFIAGHAALANGLIAWVPSVHVPASLGETQATLASQLRAQGYNDIVLSAVVATPANPRPQNNPANTTDPAGTAVHAGWNGVASKEGQVVQIYAVQASQPAAWFFGPWAP